MWYNNISMNIYQPLTSHFELKVGSIVEVVKGKKRYVLVYRSGNKGRGFLEITRGKVEVGSLEQNVIRETWEETGLRCRIIRPMLLSFYVSSAARHSDCQIYYICRPLSKVDVARKWLQRDYDPHKHGRRWYNCYFVPVAALKPAEFKNGQDAIIRHYLKSLKKK